MILDVTNSLRAIYDVSNGGSNGNTAGILPLVKNRNFFELLPQRPNWVTSSNMEGVQKMASDANDADKMASEC
jgi:hypothetical protein